MSGFKNFLTSILIILIIGFGIWFVIQVKSGKEKKRMEAAFNDEKYEEILSYYKKLKLKEDKKTPNYLRRCFYKSVALYNSGEHENARPFFDHLLKASSNTRFRSYSNYYLGEILFKEKDYKLSETYFSAKELNNPGGEFFILSKMGLSKIYVLKGELDKASSTLRTYIENEKIKINEEDLLGLKQLSSEINLKRIYSRRITENSIDYIIKPSDTLLGIAKKNGTTVDLIKKTNSVKSNIIRPNNHLKVITSQFSIIVSKSNNLLTVYENGEFFKEYHIGTGRENTTPTGDFKITGKQVNPTWYKHDGSIIPFGSKENELGTRWMSINYPGYGIHGTWNDESIGKQSSAGCIRLKNSDVEEIFLYITAGTEVKIVD